MENTTAVSNKTELNDRTLWFDGDSSFDPNKLLQAMQRYDNVRYVNEIDETVTEFNRHCSKSQKLVKKQEVRPLSFDWNLPEEYKKLDVQEYVTNKLIEVTNGMTDREFRNRAHRMMKELKMYESRGLFDVLRTIIFVINTLTTSNTVWGVGRGSSVSSYVLYLIGVHDVDSYQYNLDIEDFLHD